MTGGTKTIAITAAVIRREFLFIDLVGKRDE
jgi:hypothetical protein